LTRLRDYARDPSGEPIDVGPLPYLAEFVNEFSKVFDVNG
jgi:hypothetical protein